MNMYRINNRDTAVFCVFAENQTQFESMFKAAWSKYCGKLGVEYQDNVADSLMGSAEAIPIVPGVFVNGNFFL